MRCQEIGRTAAEGLYNRTDATARHSEVEILSCTKSRQWAECITLPESRAGKLGKQQTK